MKLIYLLRHAKSGWDDPGLSDLQRVLSKRGRRSAELMAEHIREAGVRPAVVLCSPSMRTRQTLAIIEPELHAPTVTFERRIYEASRQTLLACLTELPASAESVLLIGHNPGLERLALQLVDEAADSPALARLREKYPTGTLAVLTAAIDDWSQLRDGICTLDAFVRPADLDEDAERS